MDQTRAALESLRIPVVISHRPAKLNRKLAHSNINYLIKIEAKSPALVSIPVITLHKRLKMALLNVRSLSIKTFIFYDLITFSDLDFMFKTDSWLCFGDHSLLVELCSPEIILGRVVVVAV